MRGFNAKLSLCETQKRQISLNRFPCSKNMAEQVSTAVIYVQSLQKNSAYLELTSNADVEAQKTRLRLLGNPFAVVAESAPSHIQMELIELLFWRIAEFAKTFTWRSCWNLLVKMKKSLYLYFSKKFGRETCSHYLPNSNVLFQTLRFSSELTLSAKTVGLIEITCQTFCSMLIRHCISLLKTYEIFLLRYFRPMQKDIFSRPTFFS